MDGNKNIAALNLAFVLLGFQFGNTHADKRAGNTANRRTGPGASQRCHDRASGDKRSHPGNRQGANASKPAEHSADDATGTSASSRAFGSFRMLFVRKISGS